MLDNVALGQSRFITPGIAPDRRGIVTGRYGLLLFPTLDGVVSWLRLYSSEASLDELLGALAISRVRSELRTQSLAVRIPSLSSYVLDRASRCAKIAGGTAFTGTNKHFVRYRDEQSPYGYDALEIPTLAAEASFMVHGVDFQQSYSHEADIAFERLLFRLSPRRIPGTSQDKKLEVDELFITVARGIAGAVVEYLWRNQVAAKVGLASARSDGAFSGAERSHYVIRADSPPRRILELFLATPGIEVFRAVSDNVAVELGFEHPINLSACSAIFDPDQYFFFRGEANSLDVLQGPLELSDVSRFTRVELGDSELSRHEFAVDRPQDLGVNLRLAPSMTPPRRVIGTLIDLSEAERFKQLVYLLPKTSLQGHRVAVTERGIVVVASPKIELIPLGTPLCEVTPNLLVPIGLEVLPRVSGTVLASSVGHSPGVLTVFTPDNQPFQIDESAMSPLERESVARLAVESVAVSAVSSVLTEAPAVQNAKVGYFALWGFSAPSSHMQLAASASGAGVKALPQGRLGVDTESSQDVVSDDD